MAIADYDEKPSLLRIASFIGLIAFVLIGGAAYLFAWAGSLFVALAYDCVDVTKCGAGKDEAMGLAFFGGGIGFLLFIGLCVAWTWALMRRNA